MTYQGNKARSFNAPMKTATYQTRPEIEQLREELLVSPFFQSIQNRTLVELQQDVTYLIEQLVKERKITAAKKYQNLSIAIDKEARKRLLNPGMAPPEPMDLPKNSKEGKKVAKFDAETEAKLEQMRQRQESMVEAFKELWDTDIKAKYFVPSPQLKRMQKKLNEYIQEGSAVSADEMRKSIEEQEELEQEQNQINYDRDYSDALKQLMKKHNKEMKNYLQDRKRQRVALIPLKPVGVDKSLNRAKSRYLNTSFTALPQKPKLIEPATKKPSSSFSSNPQKSVYKKQSKTTQNTVSSKSVLSPLKPTRVDYAGQTEYASDSEFFDDYRYEGVMTEEEMEEAKRREEEKALNGYNEYESSHHSDNEETENYEEYKETEISNVETEKAEETNKETENRTESEKKEETVQEKKEETVQEKKEETVKEEKKEETVKEEKKEETVKEEKKEETVKEEKKNETVKEDKKEETVQEKKEETVKEKKEETVQEKKEETVKEEKKEETAQEKKEESVKEETSEDEKEETKSDNENTPDTSKLDDYRMDSPPSEPEKKSKLLLGDQNLRVSRDMMAFIMDEVSSLEEDVSAIAFDVIEQTISRVIFNLEGDNYYEEDDIFDPEYFAVAKDALESVLQKIFADYETEN